MAAFYSILSSLYLANIRRTGQGLCPYPATTHTRGTLGLMLYNEKNK